MGLSASQGRLLSLTSRLSDLEYRSQVISNSKMRLADQSEAVSKSYLDALDLKKLTVYNPAINSQVDASLVSLYQMNAAATGNSKKRVVVDANGNMVVSSYDYNKYRDAKTSKQEYEEKVLLYSEFYNDLGISINTTASELKNISDELLRALSDETRNKFLYKTGNSTKTQGGVTIQTNTYTEIPTSIEDILDDDGNVVKKGVQTLLNELAAQDENDNITAKITSISSTEAAEAIASINDYANANTNKNIAGSFDTKADADTAKAYLYQQLLAVKDLYDTKKAYEDLAGYLNITASNREGDADNYSPIGITSCPEGYETDTDYLYTQLNNGNWYIVEYNQEGGKDATGAWDKISWSSGDPQLQTVSDEGGLARAEAEYETAMSQIQSKDKRFDLELKMIDSEHSAVQTEMDSVKKVMDKNIDNTFKIFS